MGYELYLHAPGPGRRPKARDIARWLDASPWVCVEQSRAQYRNEHTGLGFVLELGGDRAEALVELHISRPVPHVLPYEIEPLLAGLVDTFGLEVCDPQTEDASARTFDRERFQTSFASFNRHLHAVKLGHLWSELPPMYPRASLERAWRWNGEHRAAVRPDEWSFPTMQFARVDGVLGTLVVLTGRKSVMIPDADWVLAHDARGTPILTPLHALHGALAASACSDAPIRHWRVDAGSDALVSALMSGERRTPTIVPASSVLTQELVEEAIVRMTGSHGRSAPSDSDEARCDPRG
jgi:hypothetical protein